MNTTNHKYTNALIDESSPYLLQHAHNPVNWHPWSEETLDRAKKENKMLIISIGYAACHWCHVMEHESFEDSTVAALMNEYFLPIKVDREERPDVDDVYMTACQLVSQRGCGWPLNAFAMPDGRPVWAGTYFPKDQWINILNQFKALYTTEPQKLEDSADRITKGIQNFESSDIVDISSKEFDKEKLTTIGRNFLANIDMQDGGRRGSPKFPMPSNWEFLLKYYDWSGSQKAKDAVTVTLNKMAAGGIYDQLGGGFARYSVDSIWLVPHFEKMLYDNGQLLSLYSHAFTLTREVRYKQVIQQTIAFLQRELQDKAGGFYASLDADSEGEEGKFYVWSYDEIRHLINDNTKADLYCKYYDVTPEGNFEGHNILNDGHGMEDEDLPTLSDKEATIIAECNKLLFDARSSRIRPNTDDKVLTGWNGLLNKGLSDAYAALGNESYLELAKTHMDFLLKNQMQKDGRLYRNYKNGKSTINAFLDDYAAVIDALIRLYEVTFDKTYLDNAQFLTDYTITHFEDPKGYFYFTSDLDPKLVARKKEMSDNVISSSNSMMARNLLKLGTLLNLQHYLDKSRTMMLRIEEVIANSMQPNFYANWCQLYLDYVHPPYEVVVIGPEAHVINQQLQSNFLPNALFLGSTSSENLELLKDKFQEGKTMIYVCQNKVCKLPVTNVDEALKLIN